MLGFIAGAVIGAALGIFAMGLLQTAGYEYPEDEEDYDEEKRD